MLWVWPTAGADAWLEASATPVATAAAEFGDLPGEWGMVELPVGYAPALENQFDPSHAEWLHAKYDEDGQLSAANVAFSPMTRFDVKEGTMNDEGFVVEHGGYNAGNKGVSRRAAVHRAVLEPIRVRRQERQEVPLRPHLVHPDGTRSMPDVHQVSGASAIGGAGRGS